MLNILAIQGRLVADPEMKTTPTGRAVTSFRVACDRNRKDANGQVQADFFTVVAWEKSAEFICQYFQKGSMIVIHGELQSRQYQDKNGNNRTAIEILARGVNFCGGKTASGNDSASQNGSYSASSKIDRVTPQDVAAAQVNYSSGSFADFAPIDDNEDLPF